VVEVGYLQIKQLADDRGKMEISPKPRTGE